MITNDIKDVITERKEKEIRAYIIKRILIGVLVLFVLSLVIYGLIRLMPGDYVQNTTAGNLRLSEEAREQLARSYGLDSSPTEGYLRWAQSSLTGDLGVSFLYKKPVIEVIAKTLPTTLLISATALFVQLCLALFLGIRSAISTGKKWKLLYTSLTVLSISLPAFFVALLLQKWMALDWNLLPLQGQASLRYEYTGFLYAIDAMKHLILPILTLVITGTGGMARYIREHTESILASEFVFGAITRGFGEKQIVRYLVLPNLRVLLAVIIGREIPGLLTRTLIVEEIFALSGLGSSVFAGLAIGDFPLIMGFSMIFAMIVLLCAIGEDILYTLTDPRIRLGKGGTHYAV